MAASCTPKNNPLKRQKNIAAQKSFLPRPLSSPLDSSLDFLCFQMVMPYFLARLTPRFSLKI